MASGPLERRLGLGNVVVLSISAMMGSGVLILPGLAIGKTGDSAWLAYALAGFFTMPAAFSKAELASAMPKSGGSYVFIQKAFGPLSGTVFGLGLWFSLLLKSAFSLVGIGAYLSIIGKFDITSLAICFLGMIFVMNILGVQKVSKFQTWTVALFISTLLLLILSGLSQPTYQPPVKFLQYGATGLLECSAFVFIAYAGVTKIAAIAGEVKNPAHNIPTGMLLSLGITIPLYCLCVWTLGRTVPNDLLVTNIYPLYTMAEHLGGQTAGLIICGVAIITMVSMANAGLLAASRFPYAMAQDGLVPKKFLELHRKHSTPVTSIVVTTIAMLLFIVFSDIEKIIKLASAMKIMAFGLNNLAVLALRISNTQWYKPSYRSPLYPLTQIFGCLISVVLLLSMGEMALYAILTILIPGIPLFFLYGRKRNRGKGVLSMFLPRKDLAQKSVLSAQQQSSFNIPPDTSMIPIMGRENSIEMLAKFGACLSSNKDIEVTHIKEVPYEIDLELGIKANVEVSSIRRRLLTTSELTDLKIRFDSVITHDLVKEIHTMSSRYRCQWLVMSFKKHRFFNPIGWLVNHLPCNLALFRDESIRYIREIAIYLEPDPSDRMLPSVIKRLSTSFNAKITLLRHISPDDSPEEIREASRYLSEIEGRSQIGCEKRFLEGYNDFQLIVNVSQHYDLLVLSDTAKKSWKNLFGHSRADHLCEEVFCSTLMLKFSKFQQPIEAPEEKRVKLHPLGS